MLQVLPTRHDQHRIQAPVFEGQLLVDVEVLDKMAAEPGVGGQLLAIQAMADHLAKAELLGQVTHPATHQIEQHRTRLEAFPIELGEATAKSTIEVLHEAGVGIEQLIAAGIQLLALGFRKQGLGHGI